MIQIIKLLPWLLFILGATVPILGAVLFFQPPWILSMVAKIAPGVVYFATTEAPLVALTIDDGPDLNSTPKILKLLSRYQSQATFFVISSRVSKNEDIVATMVREGHEIGNHLTQDEPSIKLSPEAFKRALLEADRVLRQFSKIRWLRPAGGWYNRQMIAITQKHNYQVALGSIFPYDTHIPSSWFASRQILTNVRPGSIIVLHDSGNRGNRTASTLSAILPELRYRGYRVVTLSTLFDGVKHHDRHL